MSPALVQLIITLIGQLITEAPSIIVDIEKLIAAAKGTPLPAVNDPVPDTMAADLKKLETPIVKS